MSVTSQCPPLGMSLPPLSTAMRPDGRLLKSLVLDQKRQLKIIIRGEGLCSHHYDALKFAKRLCLLSWASQLPGEGTGGSQVRTPILP